MSVASSPSLFDALAERPGPYRHGQPETARAAAERNLPARGTQRGRVLTLLAQAGERGATDHELAEAAGIVRPHVAGTRRKELADLGLVEATELRRLTDTRSPAVVWRITDAGVRVFREMTEAKAS